LRSGIQQPQYRYGRAIPGQGFGYEYDGIGNRTRETRGVTENEIKYTANNLNQYTQRNFAIIKKRSRWSNSTGTSGPSQRLGLEHHTTAPVDWGRMRIIDDC